MVNGGSTVVEFETLLKEADSDASGKPLGAIESLMRDIQAACTAIPTAKTDADTDAHIVRVTKRVAERTTGITKAVRLLQETNPNNVYRVVAGKPKDGKRTYYIFLASKK
jgi:CCR4-NOT transcriptional regulation complex NOT5 subunit